MPIASWRATQKRYVYVVTLPKLASKDMTYAPNAFDFTLAAMLLAGTLVEVRLLAACGQAGGRDGAPHARTRAYTYLIAYQWLLVAAVFALWVASARPWTALLFGPIISWRFGAGVVLAAAYIVFLVQQRHAVLSRPPLLERVRASLGPGEAILPHTAQERNLWTYGALTAGFCEEVLFRGFLFALVASFAGLVAAVLIGAALFGLYHANQGRAAIVKTAAAGLVFAVIAVASGSLIPVILIHAAQDLIVGDMAYRAVTAPRV